MKKINLDKSKLNLKKTTISDLDQNNFKGGRRFTGGCSDGCTSQNSLLRTHWNCTKADCTADCGCYVVNQKTNVCAIG